jgi:hypothetical protein
VGFFFVEKKHQIRTTLNGYIVNVVAIIKTVVASAEESEVGASFENAQSGALTRITLIELGHKQPRQILHM